MSIAQKIFKGPIFASTLSLICCAPMQPEATAAAASPVAQTSPSTAPQSAACASITSADDELSDSEWHYYATGYLWLPGIHGTLGVRGLNTGVHVSAIGLLSNFRFGLMGIFTPT